MDDVKHSVWVSRHGIATVRVEEACTWRDEYGRDREAVAYRYQVADGWGRLYVISQAQFLERFERALEVGR